VKAVIEEKRTKYFSLTSFSPELRVDVEPYFLKELHTKEKE